MSIICVPFSALQIIASLNGTAVELYLRTVVEISFIYTGFILMVESNNSLYTELFSIISGHWDQHWEDPVLISSNTSKVHWVQYVQIIFRATVICSQTPFFE